MRKKEFFLIFLSITTSLSASNVIYQEEKISVYDVKNMNSLDLNSNEIANIEKKKPNYVIKKSSSKDKEVIYLNDNVTVIVNKNRNHVFNYNDLLKLTAEYSKNIPLADTERINSLLDAAKFKTSYEEKNFKEDSNEEFIVAIKESTQKKSDSNIAFADLSILDNISYFIDNYNTINKDILEDKNKDIRYQLVSTIKEQSKQFKHIDSTAIDYFITLDELKLLKSTIINQN